MLVIDANIWIRFLTNDNQRQYEDCRALFAKISEDDLQAYCPSIVLAEIVWVMTKLYGRSNAEAKQILQHIYLTKNIHITDDYQTYLAINMFGTKTNKFGDAMIASLPKLQSKEWELVSYDKEFDRLGVKRVEPNEILEQR